MIDVLKVLGILAVCSFAIDIVFSALRHPR